MQAVSAEGGADLPLSELTKKLKGAHYLVFLAFFVTLAAFPGETAV